MKTTITLFETSVAIDTDYVVDSFAFPFLRAAEWVRDNPHSKRLPNGMSFNGCRNGFPSVVAFCNEWSALVETFPACNKYSDLLAPVFAVREEYYAD